MPQHTPHITYHRLGSHGAIGDDLGDLFAPVVLRHIIDHPISPLHAEIDIEVGHGDTFGIQEALEQQVVGQRVEIGNGQRIGHQGTGARTTPRPDRNTIVLGPLDKIGNDQKIAGESHLVDDIQLHFQPLVIGATTLGKVRCGAIQQHIQALLQAINRELAKILRHRQSVRHRKFRQEILAQTQLQIAAAGDLHGVFQRLGNIRKQLGHLLRAAQVLLFAVAMGTARIIQRAPFRNAHPHLVGIEVFRTQKTHIVAGHHRHPHGAGQGHRLVQIVLLTGTAAAADFQIVVITELAQPAGQQLGRQVALASEQGLAHIPLATTG